MPRSARIDAPGAVHHIIARGIERRKIFYDDQDRDAFVKRLGDLVSETGTRCYAWALIPNHFHLLLKTRQVPVATLMRRLLTGYAIGFNRRHRRSGHVFQNRYKSILCERDAYLKELVRYTHLNPLRARVVTELKALDRYPYCGHSCLTGRKKNVWQTTDEVLALFSDRLSLARRRYRDYLKKGIGQGRRADLMGGGLVRSAGGWAAVRAMRMAGVFSKSDERILGSSDFVEDVLSHAQETMEKGTALKAEGIGYDQVVAAVADLLSLQPHDLLGPGKERTTVKGRILVCYWAVKELGMSMTEVAKKIGIAVPTVSVAVKKGCKIVNDEGLLLADILNIKM
jgi:REP element-mobilizing transposase RayT